MVMGIQSSLDRTSPSPSNLPQRLGLSHAIKAVPADPALLKSFMEHARCVRVRFTLLQSDDDAELFKWKDMEGAKSIVENTGLIGIRKVLSTVHPT